MQTLDVTHMNATTRVTLNRPDVRNAFSGVMVQELHDVFAGLPAATRVVVLAGAGKAFCAGADVAWMRASAALSQTDNQIEAAHMAAMFRCIDECPKLVIARVQGAAIGGGMGLLACCDVVVAADDTKLGFTEVRLGIVPAVISPFVVAKIGPAAARRWFLTGELFSAEQGRSMGLVHEVAPPSDLDAAVEAQVHLGLQAGPAALGHAKALIRQVAAWHGPEDATGYTSRLIAELRASPEGQEGLAAFLEKRPPRWRVE